MSGRRCISSRITSRSQCCERYSSGSASLARSEGSSKSRYKALGLSCSSKERARVVLPAWRGPSSATAGKCCSKSSNLALATLGIIFVIMPRHRIIARSMLRLVGDTARARGPIWTIETAARMLGTDKSRGYSLEMICADFLAGAPGQWQPGEPAQLDLPLLRVLALQQQQAFLENLREQGVMRTIRQKAAPSRLDP